MSTPKTTEYGTKSNVSVAVNLKYMLRGIQFGYNRLRTMRHYRDINGIAIPYTKRESEIIEGTMRDMKAKANLVKMHMDCNNLSIRDRRWSNHFYEYLSYLEQFEAEYNDIVGGDCHEIYRVEH